MKSKGFISTVPIDPQYSLTRRDMLKTVASPVIFPIAPLLNVSGKQAEMAEGGTTYDLLIKGGKVIDPSQNLEEIRDVAILGGKIASLEKNIPSNRARSVVDATGKIVTPGLIDVHVHVFPYVGETGTEPDPCCISRGVTTAVDAGSCGAFTLPAFRRYIIEKAETRIRVIVHIVAIGMIVSITPGMEELGDLRYCDPERAVKAAAENKDLVVGFKIRIDRKFTVPGTNDIVAMRRARIASDEVSLPLTIHIGGSYSPLKEFLALMKEGDIATHIYNPRPNSILDSDGKLLPEVLDARSRGVRFDIGHGRTNFSFAVAEKCFGQQFLPDTISSDVSNGSLHGPAYDLVTTMSKFLLLGMNLREVVERTTVNAARALNFGLQIGTLKPGAEADVAVLDLAEGEFPLTDSDGQTRIGHQKIIPVATVRGGKLFHPVPV